MFKIKSFATDVHTVYLRTGQLPRIISRWLKSSNLLRKYRGSHYRIVLN